MPRQESKRKPRFFSLRNNEPNEESILNDKNFRTQLADLDKLIQRSNLTMYGTDRIADVEQLNDDFQSLLNSQIGSLTNNQTGDITSFLGQLVSSDNKNMASDDVLTSQFMSITENEFSTVQSFIYDAYKNRLLEQSDIHEVSSQLIELSEAILITRDAIISSDVVEGRMSRTLSFENIDDRDVADYTSMVEHMENKFKLLEKIKNFIIPYTLEYGEYYAYIIPYSKLFENFMKVKDSDFGGRGYKESTLMESFDPKYNKKHEKNPDSLDNFIESAWTQYNVQESTKYKQEHEPDHPMLTKEEFTKDLKNILGNVSVCNDSVPLPVLEEGMDSIEFFKQMKEHMVTEAEDEVKLPENWFKKVNTPDDKSSEGMFQDSSSKKKSMFSDIGDCYLKMIEPTRIIPIKIMNTTIGYYYVQDENITPLSGGVSQNLYYTKFDEHSRESTIIDAIANRVVKSFDKPFLQKNIKFKEAIVDCINYYNLNEKRLKFQFIPPEYIQEFKIDEDVNGNGTSMIKKSLFYAKLYLMLLLFKIMSIFLNSNDTKVNYLKQSGIDKDIANKVQEIARIRQSRQINITDLFSYTTLINKVGNGAEMYVPTGRSGERPMETEILAGQEVQLNSDLLEMLKNAYILGTGVPAAIVNYMNEADFAKVIEQNNTKFNGRVVNYQLDFNSNITEMYKKLMKWSTSIPENVWSNFNFILQAPKTVAINTKSELIGQFSSLADFLVQIFYGDPSQEVNADEINKEIRSFKKLLAKEQLPMMNIDKVEELMKQAKIDTQEERLRPKSSNGDSGDDLGLEEDLKNMDL